MRLDLSKLNPNQKKAVLFGDGPLLILAGAGSGKTSTMAYRIAHLVAERGVSSKSILGLSFTRKAAEELKERVHGLIAKTAGAEKAKGLRISTFHSLCVQILREYAHLIGFPKNFTIIDRADQVEVVRSLLKQVKLDDRKFDPETMLFAFGQAKNKFLTGEAAEGFFLSQRNLPEPYAIMAASIFEKYQTQLKAMASFDFDDLLFRAVELLEANDVVRSSLNARFRYILVDEYQDTNPAQFRLLEALTVRSQNLCVVGDDDQSIYGWRGADPTHILEFKSHFPDAEVITLDQNYRSTTTILDAANAVIANNRVRHPKKLWSDQGHGESVTEFITDDDRDEVERVGDEILSLARSFQEGKLVQSRPWKDFAILFRSNPQSRLFEEALRMRQIPYKLVGTLSFLDRKEVKNALSYWRVVINPYDDASLRRIIGWPACGIGRTSIEKLSTRGIETGKSLYLMLKDQLVPEHPDHLGLNEKTQAGIREFLDRITALQISLSASQLTPQSVSEWARKSLEIMRAKEALEADYEDDPVQVARRMENIEELASSIGQMHMSEIEDELTDSNPSALLTIFLARMTLGEIEDKQDEKDKEDHRDQVTLMTLHGAKGLEFPVVFLVGMEDGYLPHQRSIDEARDLSEERRLCYVGITRAKHRLYLVRAKYRIRYGKKVPRNPSRFLQEIPEDLRVKIEGNPEPDLSSPEAVDEHELRVKNFLSQIRSQISAKS